MYTKEELIEAILFFAPGLESELKDQGSSVIRVAVPAALQIAITAAFITQTRNRHAVILREAACDLSFDGFFNYS
jgi:hypothetical protein